MDYATGGDTAKNQQLSDRRQLTDSDEYFNAQFGAKAYYLDLGESGCGNTADEMIVATIGAGIVVTIHDKDLQIGGMAYLLIPDTVLKDFPNIKEVDPNLMDKVFKPLEDCIALMKQMGAGKNRIRIRIIGGTHYNDDDRDRGTKNYILVKQYLAEKGLSAISEDMNGPYIRRVHFFPSSGHAVRRQLKRQSDYEYTQKQEQYYQNQF